MGLVLAGCQVHPMSRATGVIEKLSGYHVTLQRAFNIAGTAALLYYVIDPLAPNWDIQETRIGEDRVVFALRMKQFHSGGDGEARLVLERRAEVLARELGFDGYQLVRYREGIESTLPVAQRFADGEIRLRRTASGS